MDRILFAEDDKRLRETFCDYFTAKGFSVTLAENGEKAAAIAAEEAFDLNVNRKILEEVINAGNNAPYWALAPSHVTRRDLRNPAYAQQRKAVMLQMLGAANREDNGA